MWSGGKEKRSLKAHNGNQMVGIHHRDSTASPPIKIGTASPLHRMGMIDGAEKQLAAALECFRTEQDDGE